MAAKPQPQTDLGPTDLTPTDRAHLALFAVVALLVGFILWRARATLAPFAVGLVLAYILVPLVDRVQRWLPGRIRRWSQARLLSVLLVYAVAALVVTLAAAAIIPVAAQQAGQFVSSLPQLISSIQDLIEAAVASYETSLIGVLGPVPPDALGPLLARFSPEEILADATGALLAAVQAGVEATLRVLSGTLGWLLGFVIIPFWMVYLVTDNQRLLKGSAALVPSGLRADVQALTTIVDEVLSAYIRGQLIIAVFLGSLATVAMTVLGVPYPLLLGVATGVLGFIPFLGAILGAAVAVIVALTESSSLAFKALVAYIVVQQVDNFLITPRTHSEAVALHPAVIMVVLAIGGALFGAVGLLVAVPVTAILRDTVHYTYLRVGADGLPQDEALRRVGYKVTAAGPALNGAAANAPA